MESELSPKPETLAAVSAVLPAEYSLVECVGSGGHGVVYKARYLVLDRIVALKVLANPEGLESSKEAGRLKNEAKILGRLDHPNIVKVYQFGFCTDGAPYMACEFLYGQNLSSYLEEKGVLPVAEIGNIIGQCLDALAFAHDLDLVHRDIKPSNIMLIKRENGEGFEVKLLDFGIAKPSAGSAQNSDPLNLTQSRNLSGSPNYMSPEQCCGLPQDRRSDLYSMGCVIYECLRGHPPFVGETPMLTVYKHLNDTPDLPLLVKEFNQPLRSFLLRALKKDPALRPQSAQEFKQEFLAALAKESGSKSQSKTNFKSKFKKFVIFVGLITLAFGLFLVAGSKQFEKSKEEPKRIARHALLAETRIKQLRDRCDKLFANIRLGLDRKEAESAIEEAKSILRQVKGSKALELPTLWSLADLFQLLEDWKSEEALSLQMLKEQCSDGQGKPTAEAAQVYYRLSKLAERKNDLRSMEKYARQVIDLRHKIESGSLKLMRLPASGENFADSWIEGQAWQDLGFVYEVRSIPKEALKCYDKSIAIRERSNDLPDANTAYLAKANIYYRQSEQKVALAMLANYFDRVKARAEDDPLPSLLAIRNLANWYIAHDEFGLARTSIDAARAIISQFPSFNDQYGVQLDDMTKELNAKSRLKL